MEMNAYYEDYVEDAQNILGHMMDFAVNTCNIDADKYFDMFIVSGIAEQFGIGNTMYVAGMTGCELVKKVTSKVGLDYEDVEEVMYLDKSPEYWSGWALAYYQWYSNKSFSKIIDAVPISEIIGMYPTLHEADISKFICIMDEKLKSFYTEINLKQRRILCGYSQSKLAEMSGVSIRQIQLFEQRQRDINKASVECVYKLARALYCSVEDLIE